MIALFVYILILLFPLSVFATNSPCTWVHFKKDVSIGEVKALVARNHLSADKILSNPFRAQICEELSEFKFLDIKNNILVMAVNQSKTPLIQNHYYSAFGFTKEQREKWTINFFIAVPIVVTAFGSSAWDWGKDGMRFGFGNEDWFDKNSYSGGADKVGHMTSLYIEKRFATWLALQAGHDIKTAQRYGLYTAGLIGIALELGDGLSKYKFSSEDLFMDSLGISFAWCLDQWPWLDDLIGLRWEWWPSREYRDSRNKAKLDLTSDYSGQKVYLSLKATGIPHMKQNILSRYLTLDFGFFTRGYEPDLSPENKEDNIRRRYLSLGIGLNLGSIIFESGAKSSMARAVGSITKYWIPTGVTHAIQRKEL